MNYEVTPAQQHAIEVIKDDFDLDTPIGFKEMVVDGGINCHLTPSKKLGAIPVDQTLRFEIQEDQSIVVTLEETFQEGYTALSTTHFIETNGEIQDL